MLASIFICKSLLRTTCGVSLCFSMLMHLRICVAAGSQQLSLAIVAGVALRWVLYRDKAEVKEERGALTTTPVTKIHFSLARAHKWICICIYIYVHIQSLRLRDRIAQIPHIIGSRNYPDRERVCVQIKCIMCTFVCEELYVCILCVSERGAGDLIYAR